VADMTVIGSNAAYCTLKADHLARVPAGLDPAEAATLILPAPAQVGPPPARRARACAGRCRRGRAGAACARQTGRRRDVGHCTGGTCGTYPRFRRDADRLPARRLYARFAGWLRGSCIWGCGLKR
jgi:hypothetical protein